MSNDVSLAVSEYQLQLGYVTQAVSLRGQSQTNSLRYHSPN